MTQGCLSACFAEQQIAVGSSFCQNQCCSASMLGHCTPVWRKICVRVLAVTQGFCEPVLQSGTEQWGVSSHKTMPSGTDLHTCSVRFIKWLCTVFICDNRESLSRHHTSQPYERTGCTRDENKEQRRCVSSRPNSEQRYCIAKRARLPAAASFSIAALKQPDLCKTIPKYV